MTNNESTPQNFISTENPVRTTIYLHLDYDDEHKIINLTSNQIRLLEWLFDNNVICDDWEWQELNTAIIKNKLFTQEKRIDIMPNNVNSVLTENQNRTTITLYNDWDDEQEFINLTSDQIKLLEWLLDEEVICNKWWRWEKAHEYFPQNKNI